METIVLQGQSLVDIAIQTTGSVESIVELAVANNVSITQQMVGGTELQNVGVRNKQVADYLAARGISPATQATEMQGVRKRGIGNMTIGQDFKVG